MPSATVNSGANTSQRDPLADLSSQLAGLGQDLFSESDISNAQGNIAGAASAGTDTAIGNMAGQMSGDVGSGLFMQNAARLRAGSASAGASAGEQFRLQAKQANTAQANVRTGQKTQLAGLKLKLKELKDKLRLGLRGQDLGALGALQETATSPTPNFSDAFKGAFEQFGIDIFGTQRPGEGSSFFNPIAR